MPRFITKFIIFRINDGVFNFLLVYNSFTRLWSLPTTKKQQFIDLHDLIGRTFGFVPGDYDLQRISYDDKESVRNLLVSVASDNVCLSQSGESQCQWKTPEQILALESEMQTNPDIVRGLGHMFPMASSLAI